MNGNLLHTDVLPIHPQPEPLESFTSYLMRLAEPNGLRSFHELAERLLPGWRAGNIRTFNDNMPRNFGNLVREAVTSEEVLRATTFFHLANKFGRAGRVKSIMIFLMDSLAGSLRYCPLCIRDSAYYRLPWRFNVLKGCPIHHGWLLDRCGHCSQEISILHTVLKLGICPHCQGQLMESEVEFLPSEELDAVAQIYEDLCFLLLPQPWETGDAYPAVAAGSEFQRLRRKTRLSALATAREWGLAHLGVLSIERGGVGASGALLQRYFDYARILGVSVQQIFEEGLATYQSPQEGEETLEYPEKVARKLERATLRLQAEGRRLEDDSARELVGLSWQTLLKHQETRNVIMQVREQEFEASEQEILEQLEQLVEQYQQAGEPVIKERLYQELGHRPDFFLKYPQVKAYLAQFNKKPGRSRGTRPAQPEGAVLRRVNEAIDALTQEGSAITQVEVAARVGLSYQHLLRYPTVKKRLGNVRALRFSIREQQTVKQVEEAVAKLVEMNQPVSRKAVRKLTGLSDHLLKRYPQVTAIFDKHTHVQVRHRHLDYAARVQQAIALLKNQGKPLTQTAICQVAGLSDSTGRYYPHLWSIIKPVLDEEPHRHKADLLKRTTAAIRELKATNQRISKPSVCKLIGMSVAGFQKYPDAVQLVRVGRIEARNAREDAWTQKIEEAAHSLREEGIPVTIASICVRAGLPYMTLLDYPRAKAAADEAAAQYHKEHRTRWSIRYSDQIEAVA